MSITVPNTINDEFKWPNLGLFFDVLIFFQNFDNKILVHIYVRE